MNIIDALGLTAGAFTTLSFIPQVMLVFKSGSTKDISLGMYAIYVTGILCWLIYGLLAPAMPVAVANAVTLLLSGFILALKLRNDVFGRRKKTDA